MTSRVCVLKPLILAAGLAALLPALGSAQAPGMHRKPGMWETTMSLNGQQMMTMGMCTDEATEQRYSVVNPQPMGRGDGSSNCTGMTPTPIPGGYHVEGACTNAGRKSHVVATIKGNFDTAYSMDVATDVDGKAQPPVHMDAKWTGACPAGRKPGDMVMPGGMVVNVNGGGGPGAGGR
jgi:hypothetical protein